MTERLDPECRQTLCTPKEWDREIAKLSVIPLDQQLDKVNDFINKYPYKVTGPMWHTPQELEVRGAGDCKDHAIAKMALLLALGVDEKRLKILVLHDDKHHFTHAILVFDDTKYLDDQTDQILSNKDVPYYHEIYAINFDGWWLY